MPNTGMHHTIHHTHTCCQWILCITVMGYYVLLSWDIMYYCHGILCITVMGYYVLLSWDIMYYCHGILCITVMGYYVLLSWDIEMEML